MVTFLRPALFLLFFALVAMPLTAKPLLIASGGYGSCPIAGSTSEMRASRQIAALAKKLDANLVKACFSLAPWTVFYRTWNNVSGRRSVEGFLTDMAKLDTRDGIYLVGQSYGGWLSMKLALALPASVSIRALATVDPISPILCKPRWMVASWEMGPAEGCTQAPKDLNGRFNEVRSRVKGWTHFFQTDYRFLHSSAIREADRVLHMEYPPSYNPFGAHFLTETDERIWNKITEAFTAP